MRGIDKLQKSIEAVQEKPQDSQKFKTMQWFLLLPAIADGRIEQREYLCITVSVDHDVVDGAPALRFTKRFKKLIEGGYGLDV